MNIWKRLFQGIIILELMSIAATVSFIVTRAQQNTSPSIVPPQTNEQSRGLETPFPSTSSPSLSPTYAQRSVLITPIPSGPRLIQVALSQPVLSSLLSSRLGFQQNTLTNFQAIPAAHDGMILKFNVQITTNTFKRVLPVEIDSVIGLNTQQKVHLHILHLKRDGQDAGPAAALQQIQTALNQLLAGFFMAQIHTMLKGMKLIGIHTNRALCCVDSEMLVLLLQLN